MARRATKPATITAEQRAALLKQVRAGYPLVVACHKANIELAAVRRAGAKLESEIDEAEVYADAHLTGLLLERGLAGDAGCLRMAIERREEREVSGATGARARLEGKLDGMADRMEVARTIAFLLVGRPDPDAILAEAKATASPAPAPAPAPPPAPEMPEGYVWIAETARVERPTGELAGHSLSEAGAITVAIADAAKRAAETTTEHAS